jgi:hypothetical protein
MLNWRKSEEIMKKSNYSFLIMQLLFVTAISSALIFAGCSRTNTGTDPYPAGGEIIFAYSIDLAIEGSGATSDAPMWWEKGTAAITAHISYKANPEEPVDGVPVVFTVSGGGNFYDFTSHDDLQRVTSVNTNKAGNAVVYFGSVAEYVNVTEWKYNEGTQEWEFVEVPHPSYDNQTITACVDEANVGNLYDNCKSITLFINGPAK